MRISRSSLIILVLALRIQATKTHRIGFDWIQFFLTFFFPLPLMFRRRDGFNYNSFSITSLSVNQQLCF